jgi:SAM-dependent methyltransferase
MTDERTTQTQGSIWSAVAEAREKIILEQNLEVFEAIVDNLAIEPGTRLLDAGCGTGEASVLAQARGAIVSGLDAAPGMIERCRVKMPGADFRVGDLEDLPYADASFDAVIACNCVHFTAHPDRAIAQLRRVTRAGGRLAIAANGRRAEFPSSEIFYALQAIAPRPEEVGDPFVLSEVGVLDRMVEAAGFRIIATPSGGFYQRGKDLEDMYATMQFVGVFVRLIEQIGEAVAKPVILEILKKHRLPDGRYELHNRTRIVVAEAR